jgi:hypothetical protein
VRYSVGYFLAGMLLAYGMTLIGVPIELGALESEKAMPLDELSSMNQQVNRVHKSDRLNLMTKVKKTPQQYHPEAVLVGCDPAFSLLSGFQFKFLGRCTT